MTLFTPDPTRDNYDDRHYDYDYETDTLTEIYGTSTYDGDGNYLGHTD